MLFFQENQPSLVHLQVPRRLLQPAQQFTYKIIIQMAHVSSEIGGVASFVKLTSMAKLRCDNEIIFVLDYESYQ
ncbi:hypothetical protein ACTXT7_002922 [Hymenolepis weldensis]